MATTEMTAVAAAVFAGLFVGHHVGDHVVQTHADARAKAIPTDDRLAAGANPWTGWPASLRHATTTTITQAAAVALVWMVAPLTAAGTVAALVVSVVSHAVIDRRWIVRAIIRAKGCYDWDDGPYLIDQSLHYAAILIAAVLAAITQSAVWAAGTAAAGTALLGAALLFERRLARTAAARIGDPTRL